MVKVTVFKLGEKNSESASLVVVIPRAFVDTLEIKPGDRFEVKLLNVKKGEILYTLKKGENG